MFDGVPKLSDFAISRTVDSISDLTRFSSRWMAPVRF